jgi:hypothetical protein
LAAITAVNRGKGAIKDKGGLKSNCWQQPEIGAYQLRHSVMSTAAQHHFHGHQSSAVIAV